MAVYLDHAATTPMLPEAISAFTEAMSVVGNPSSIHSQGQQARRMLEDARDAVAEALDCEPIEVVFTSGGTEAVNLGIKGLYWERGRSSEQRRRILLPGGEHHATVDTAAWLEDQGAELDVLPLDSDGAVIEDAAREALARDPGNIALLTMLTANNEVGTVLPVSRVATLAAARGVPVHVDAIASFGHHRLSFRSLRADGVSALSVSAHKIGGPVGIGALVLSRATSVTPLLHGGGQQRQVRSGTQDVAAAVAFATAARAVTADLDRSLERTAALRDRLIAGVLDRVPQARLRGAAPGPGRLPNNAHFTFPGCQGDSLLFLLDVAGVSVSTGSACQAGIPEVSHVLRAMGVPDDEARGALRFTLGHDSTVADVDALLTALPEAVARASRAGLSARSVLGA
ncbi:cysteine desulfurase family protein [Planctomonas psychrotolerans]|uniref:cysteine desulfurase family protein n=1 Tax=Planctomonas psychrotolerans TaxID=2528712 RepID=UPI001238966C|nr:cysteine desulfurase family protein [Planctomonas psychrotolerans]